MTKLPKLKENVPLSSYTTLQIGGPARYFTEAKSADEIVEAVLWAKEKNIPFFAYRLWEQSLSLR